MRAHTFLVLGLALAAGTAGAGESVDLSGKLTAALLFEDMLESATGTAAAVVEGKRVFGEGRHGRGLYVGKGTWLKLPLEEKTFARDQGTVMFWFKPDHESHEQSYRRLFCIDNFFGLYKDQYDRLVFNIGTKFVTTTEPRWAPGEWRHAAVTWRRIGGESTMRLYFDGTEYRHIIGRGRGTFPEDQRTDWLSIGSYGVRELFLAAMVDEFGVFNEALEAEDIRAIYGRRVSLGEIARGAKVERLEPLVNLARGKATRGQVPATNRWFPYRSIVSGTPSGGRYAKALASAVTEAGAPTWVEVDLGEAAKVNMIRLWNNMGGRYEGVKVAVSTTGEFAGEEFIVHDNARDGAYDESDSGRLFVFPARQVRYVRCWNWGRMKEKTDPSYGRRRVMWRQVMVFYDALRDQSGEK